ncbi:MAG TPA: Asp-tRNA(Asn)/Glu-tRNA(Gln) amidotransferase subunit GatC [Sphingomonadales bacterium]|nr:Asp-tRNA(Asn)/Glu-tRNA(Gln) amidotransferase subunit GatC [Sphingomonadales bacterium]
MAVDAATVKKIAHLARIRIPEARIGPMTAELNGILKWVEQLKEVETEGVPPMTSAAETKLHWREDKTTEGGIAADILKNAPETENGFFTVPRVIE